MMGMAFDIKEIHFVMEQQIYETKLNLHFVIVSFPVAERM